MSWHLQWFILAEGGGAACARGVSLARACKNFTLMPESHDAKEVGANAIIGVIRKTTGNFVQKTTFDPNHAMSGTARTVHHHQCLYC
eukprot:1692762-Ditylum_brightwellii.AAC.1